MFWPNRNTQQEDLRGQWEGEPEEFDPDQPDMHDYLSDMNDTLTRIETHLQELVNQGDKQVEFLSRLATLFEGLARGTIQ